MNNFFFNKLIRGVKSYLSDKSAEMERNADEPSVTTYNQNVTLQNIGPTDNVYEKNIDYSVFPEINIEGLDSLFIRAMAIAAYEQKITITALQRKLKISFVRAANIIEQLYSNSCVVLDSHKTNTNFNIYNSMLTVAYFNEWLDNLKDSINNIIEPQQLKSTIINKTVTAEINSLSKEEKNNLLDEYSRQFGDIEYIKDSKIVSIFSKKWRDICRKEFVVIDFETTGLSYYTDRIIEIAAIRYKSGEESERFISLVNPLISISHEASQINHITDTMVADAPTERYLIPQLIEFLGNSLIVGHYVNFDLNFLEVAAQRYGYNVKYNYIDTISVAKKIFPGLSDYRLSTIAETLNIDTLKLHRAENDVGVCAEIINIALNSLD